MHSDERFSSPAAMAGALASCAPDQRTRLGGQPFAIADFDGDGLEDAASFYPSLFYICTGRPEKT